MGFLRKLEVLTRPIGSLTPNASNARRHSRRQIRQIADSLKRFGWTNPILVDDDGNVIAGHGRLEAARLLGMCEVPTICLQGLEYVGRFFVEDASGCRFELYEYRTRELLRWNRSFVLDTGELVRRIDANTFEVVRTGECLVLSDVEQ